MLNLLENVPVNDPVAIPENSAKSSTGFWKTNKDLPGGIMVILNELQSQIGFISEPMQHYVAAKLHVPVSTVHGVVSFYSFFTTIPRGRHTIKFCMGTACYVGGMPQLIEKAKQVLGVEPGADDQRWRDHPGNLPLRWRLQPGAGDRDRRRKPWPGAPEQTPAAGPRHPGRREPKGGDWLERTGLAPAGYRRKLGIGQGRYDPYYCRGGSSPPTGCAWS